MSTPIGVAPLDPFRPPDTPHDNPTVPPSRLGRPPPREKTGIENARRIRLEDIKIDFSSKRSSSNPTLQKVATVQNTFQSILANLSKGLAEIGPVIGKGLLRAGVGLAGAALYGITKAVCIPVAFSVGIVGAFTVMPLALLLDANPTVKAFFHKALNGTAAFFQAEYFSKKAACLFNYASGRKEDDTRILETLAKIDDKISQGSLYAGLGAGTFSGGFVFSVPAVVINELKKW